MLLSILTHFVSNFLDGGLEVLTGSLALAEHVFILLKIALEVNINGKFLVEANEQVLKVLFLSTAALEVHMEVSIISLLHHVGGEAVNLYLSCGNGTAARTR